MREFSDRSAENICLKIQPYMYIYWKKVVNFITTETKTKQKHPANNQIRHIN